ncbi:MAG: hypothetical protein WCK98_00975 [bacterium]
MSLKTVFSPLAITTLSLLGVVVIGTISFLSIEVIAPKLDQNKSSSSSTSSSLQSSYSSSTSSSSSSFTGSTTAAVNTNQARISFSLNQNTGSVDYTGTVNGNNGCAFIKSHDLSLQSGKIILQIQMAAKGDICTQVITELPIQGGKVISLSQNQKDDFKNLFTVKVLN